MTWRLMLLLVLVPGVAAANDVVCTFTTECFDTEACTDTSYDLSFSADGETVSVSDVAGDFSATALPDGVGFVRLDPAAPLALLSVADGAARYSVHDVAGGYAISYFGTCEVQE